MKINKLSIANTFDICDALINKQIKIREGDGFYHQLNLRFGAILRAKEKVTAQSLKENFTEEELDAIAEAITEDIADLEVKIRDPKNSGLHCYIDLRDRVIKAGEKLAALRMAA